MSRLESKQIMGFRKINERHRAAITSLGAPATPAHKLLDPCAGEGEFLEAAAQAWHVTPYANELDGERAEKCIARFGAQVARIVARLLYDMRRARLHTPALLLIDPDVVEEKNVGRQLFTPADAALGVKRRGSSSDGEQSSGILTAETQICLSAE